MKTVRIEKVTYEILERAQRTKKVNRVEFSFTIEGKEHKVKTTNLNDYAFRIDLPFSERQVGYSNFKKTTVERQLACLEEFTKSYTDYEIIVGNCGELLINIEVERTIKRNLACNNYGSVNLFMVPSYCNTSNGMEEMYIDYSDHTKFHDCLIEYYKLNDDSISFSDFITGKSYDL